MELPQRTEASAAVTYWTKLGLPRRIARALDRAGISSLEALKAFHREDFLGLAGLGPTALKRCELLLGKPLPSAYVYWRHLGAGHELATALSGLKIYSVGALRRRPYDELRQLGLTWKQLAQADGLLERVRRLP